MYSGRYPDWYEKREDVFNEDNPDFFVGREDTLKIYWDNLFRARAFIQNMALVSQRKMGKTAILRRFCNVLFFEQREVVPFFYSFSQEEIRKKLLLYEVANDMMFTFIKQFAAFLFQRTDLLDIDDEKFFEEEITQIDHKMTAHILRKLNTYEEAIARKEKHYKIEAVFDSILSLVKRAGLRCMLVIDEVQEMDLAIYDDSNNLVHCTSALTRIYQMVSTLWLVVTGSLVSCITNQIIVDAMRNRISVKSFYPLTEVETTEYAQKLLAVLEEPGYDNIGRDVFRLTGGNPYYVQKLFFPSELYVRYKGNHKNFDSLEQLMDVFNFEVLNDKGSLYEYWRLHFDRNAENLNCDGDKPGITAKILYFIAQKSAELEKQEPEAMKVHKSVIYTKNTSVHFEEIAEKLKIDIDLVSQKVRQLSEADFVTADIVGTRVEAITDRILPIFLLHKYYKKILPDPTAEKMQIEMVKILQSRLSKVEQQQQQIKKSDSKTRQEIKKQDEKIKSVANTMATIRGDVSNLKGRKAEEKVKEAIKQGKNIFAPYKGKIAQKVLVPGIADKNQMYEIDLFVAASKSNKNAALAIEVKKQKTKVYIKEVQKFIDALHALKKEYRVTKVAAYFISEKEASKTALALLKKHKVSHVTFESLL